MTTGRFPAPPRRVGVLAGLWHGAVLAWRCLLHLKARPTELLGLGLQPLVLLALFVYVFGAAISGDRGAYLQYLLPGLVAQLAVMTSTATGMALTGDIAAGVFERFRSMPIARTAPLIGRLVADLVRFAVSSCVLVGFGVILGFRFRTGPLLSLAAYGLVLVFMSALCWVSALVGLVAKTPVGGQLFSMLMVLPLTFGSTIFVSARTLPGWLRTWVEINPVSALTEAVRALVLGGPVAGPLLTTLLWTVAITALVAPVAVRCCLRRS